MAGQRRSARNRSQLVTAAGLGLLAIPGFALGLLAGVAWEEPGLLALHLFGGTEEVAWAPPAPQEEVEIAAPEPLPAVAARPASRPLPAVAASPAPKPPPKSKPATRIRSEVLSPSAAAGRFAVQVGAFAESAAAERLASSLRSRGFAVYVKAGDARWRVRVGPLPSREEAERTAARLKGEEKLPTWVLDENAG